MGAKAEARIAVKNRRGLHARASARFVKAASVYSCRITVEKNGLAVSGKSIMGLMMLAAAPGETLTLRAEGKDAAEAVEALAGLVSRGFEEAD
jgi:phosphocarrier protein HPr